MLTIDQIRPCKIEPGLNNVLELSFLAHIILQEKHKAAESQSAGSVYQSLNNRTMFSHCCTTLLVPMLNTFHFPKANAVFSINCELCCELQQLRSITASVDYMYGF